ncbi:MAG: ankyrin repeat domain-containing protein [Sphingomicrobium sp.]
MALPTAAGAQQNDGTAFVGAVRASDGNKVAALLDKRPLGLIDSRDEDGNTALLIALGRRDEEWTGFLLTKGASRDLAGKNGDTPLIVAARVGFSEAVDWLVTMNAKVDSDNRMGETPLIVAVQQHQLPIVRTLLKAGANPDKTDFSGYSARDYALRDPRARDILKLIEAKLPKPPGKS